MSAVIEVWNTIVAIVAGADGLTLGLAVLLAAAAGFTLERVHSFTGVTLAALLGLALAKVALALSIDRAHTLDQVIADQWQAFASLPMLTFTAYALIFAALIAVVAALRAAVRHAQS